MCASFDLPNREEVGNNVQMLVRPTAWQTSCWLSFSTAVVGGPTFHAKHGNMMSDLDSSKQLLPPAWHTNLYGGDMHCTVTALIMSVRSDNERTLRKGDLPVYINIFRVVQHFQTLPKPEETQ